MDNTFDSVVWARAPPMKCQIRNHNGSQNSFRYRYDRSRSTTNLNGEGGKNTSHPNGKCIIKMKQIYTMQNIWKDLLLTTPKSYVILSFWRKNEIFQMNRIAFTLAFTPNNKKITERIQSTQRQTFDCKVNIRSVFLLIFCVCHGKF